MTQEEVFKQLTAHAKEYGFVFPSSEIYDGLSAVYDYGPLSSCTLRSGRRPVMWELSTTL